jgi:hypothetical protein
VLFDQTTKGGDGEEGSGGIGLRLAGRCVRRLSLLGALEYASSIRFGVSGKVDKKTSGRKRYHWRWFFVG